MNDHEIEIDGEVQRLRLIRDENGRALYQVTEDIPNYQAQLRFRQNEWVGGHGQYDFAQGDLYFEGQSIDTTQEGRILLGPLLQEQKDDQATPASIPAPVCYCWFPAAASGAGALFCATASHIYRLDDDGWDITGTDVSGCVDLKVYNGYLFAACGHGTAYRYSSDGDSFTTSTLDDNKAVKFFVSPNAAGTAEVLYKFDTPNELKTHSTGINDSEQWSSEVYIGDTANDITNVFLVNDNLMVGKTDGLWWYDSDGGTHQLRTDLKDNRSTDNFKYVTNWQTGTYHSEIGGMGEIIGSNYDPMGPYTDIDDIGKRGTICGLAADKDYIYVAASEVHSGTTYYYIYKGREVRKQGVLRWEWCPFIYLGENATATLAVIQHSSSVRKLWFGYGAKSYYAILSDNPTADSTYKFCASGWVRMSYVYGTNKYWDKLFQSVITETKSCTSALTITSKYRKDTDTTATQLAIPIIKNGTRRTELDRVLDCKRIQFELHLATNDDTTTPELSYFEVRGIEKPETVRVHEATYAIGDTPSKRAKTIRDFLRSARTSEKLIKFADLRYGQSIDKDYTYVVMQPGYPREVEVAHEKGRAPELGIQVRWQETSFS